jgi:membrane protease YdiL (CAAX protease family)
MDPRPDPPPATLSLVFGRFGLRAGWGLAIFIASYFILAFIGSLFAIASIGQLPDLIRLQQAAQAHPYQTQPSISINSFLPIFVIVEDGIIFFGMFLLCWLLSKLESRNLSVYGIGKSRLRDVLPGAAWGLATLSLLTLILWSAHLLVFDARILNAPAALLYGLKWLLACLLVGFAEEYCFRGYLLFTLTRGVFGLAERISPNRARTVAFWIAVATTSLLFGLIHLTNTGENAFGLFMVVLVGIVFSYALYRTGSLWWAIGFHATWDWAQSFLFGVPDSGTVSIGRLFQTHPTGNPLLSGGVAGPEGSLFCVPVVLLVLLIIRFTTRPGPQPPLESEAYPHPTPLSIA